MVTLVDKDCTLWLSTQILNFLEFVKFQDVLNFCFLIKGKLSKTSWACTGPSSAQTGSDTLFYFIQDLLHKMVKLC